jgi:hypothetical protein
LGSRRLRLFAQRCFRARMIRDAEAMPARDERRFSPLRASKDQGASVPLLGAPMKGRRCPEKMLKQE